MSPLPLPNALSAPPALPKAPVAFGPYVLDPAQARLARQDGLALGLSGRPFELLCVLVAHAGRLLEKDELLDAVWGHRHVSESVLKGAVNTVRLTLGDDARAPVYVETVPRRGYRFVAEVRPWSVAPPPGPAAGQDDAAEPVPPGNLDDVVERPVGRERELAELSALMDRHRLVTLTGLAGVGKTCLALAMAARVAEPAGGRWLLRLDELSDPALVLPTLAGRLRLGAAAATRAEALARALADRQLLLVLDNAEHLVDTVAAIGAAVLAAAPEVQLLVTSQVPLRVAGEAVLALPPLALPPEGPGAEADDPAAHAATRLLMLRIAQHQPRWQPTPADHRHLVAISHALDGLPLALELAAARVPLLGLAGVQERLNQRFALLTRGRRDAAERHRTLSAALDWTFGLLDPDARRALQQLAVFAGRFDLEDAQGVLDGDALDAVEELHARSLLVTDPGPWGVRLRLYDSVRRFALLDLAATGDEAQARLRQLDWTSQRLQALWQADLFEAPEHWLPRWQHQLDSVRDALRFGLAAEAPAAARGPAVRLAAAAARLWQRLGLFAEGAAWLQAAQACLAAPRAEHGAVDEATRALLAMAVAAFCSQTQQGDPRAALQPLRDGGMAALGDADPMWTHLAAAAELGLQLRVDPEATDRLAELAQRLRGSLSPAWPEMAQRGMLQLEAALRRRQGDLAGSLDRLAQFHALCLARGARDTARTAAFLRVQVLALLDRWPLARTEARALVLDIRAAGRERESLFPLATAAAVFLRLGPAPDEWADVRLALRLLVESGMGWWLADALPWAAWHDGRPSDAARLQQWADRLVQARGEARGPWFGGLRRQLLTLLAHADGVDVDAGPVPDGETHALVLALGTASAAEVLARAGS